MTDENRRRNIELELEKGRKSLLAARRLLEEDLDSDSVISRAYYAMMHHARALLLTEAIEPKTHSRVISQINLHFVQTGELEAEAARLLALRQADRELADYDRAAVYTLEAARQVVSSAESFINACRSVLQRRGYLPAP